MVTSQPAQTSRRIFSPPAPAAIASEEEVSSQAGVVSTQNTGDFTSSAKVPAWATRAGDFQMAPPEEVARIQARYRASRAVQNDGLSAIHPDLVAIRSVGKNDISVDLSAMNGTESAAYRAQSFELLRQISQPNPKLTFFRGVSPVATINSAAGLWTRGWRKPKSLIPLDLASHTTKEQQRMLAFADAIKEAKSDADVIFIANGHLGCISDEPFTIKEGSSEAEVTAEIKARVQAGVDSIIDPLMQPEKASTTLNFLAVELAGIAISSLRAGEFQSLFIPTSQETHNQVLEWYELFRKNFRSVQFHEDAEVQAEVVRALEHYFDAIDELGLHTIFGVQRSLHAMDAETGEILPDTPAIGEGPGVLKKYMADAGLTAQLTNLGVHSFTFENIEVVNDQPTIVLAHVQAGNALSMVVVPEEEGQAGGKPVRVELSDGRTAIWMLEQSAIPESVELDTTPGFFNTNTITMALEGPVFEDYAFEVKKNDGTARPKSNAADPTQLHDTALILGKVPAQFEEFKKYEQILSNGPKLLLHKRMLLKEDAQFTNAAKGQPGVSNLGWLVSA